MIATIETKSGPIPRCQHLSEVGGLQCYRKAHASETPHNFENCSWCAFTYDPCPVHEPTAFATHEVTVAGQIAAHGAARDALRTRAAELPEWAQAALKTMGFA